MKKDIDEIKSMLKEIFKWIQMKLNCISINKLFEYEKHVRIIDQLSVEELKNLSKLYCKLYLKQQEVISIMKPKI
jgi:hypothetical protein